MQIFLQQIFLTSANIFQTIQYITKNKVMETESRELAAISRGKIRAGSTDDWKSEQLFVPPLPPTNLRGCHLIRIQYDVFVSSVFNNFDIDGHRFHYILIVENAYSHYPVLTLC